jgi:hypothetical protein
VYSRADHLQTLHHLPGHTDGLVGMQLNLRNSGTFFFISDHCHVIENVSAKNQTVLYEKLTKEQSGETESRRVGLLEIILPG